MNARAKNIGRTLALVASVASLPLVLTACNTVKGAGTDLEETSDNTKKAFGGSSSSSSTKTTSSNDTSSTKK